MKEKRWAKYLCLFALTLIVALSAAGTKQAQAATTSGSCGDSATYEYDSGTKTLTISGSGTVEMDEDAWYAESGGLCESVTKLVIGDKITKIGSSAFSEFTSLKTVTLGAKLKTIGESAFMNCSSLTAVDMSDTVVTNIGAYAFMYCTKLKTVTFSSKLTKISTYAFYDCTKLTSVSLPSALKTIGSCAFYDTGLTKVTIPKNVTSIGSGAFMACSDLTKIAVSSGNTKYKATSGVLYNYDKTKIICYPAGKSSTSFTVPGTVTTISAYAFNGAANLKSISLNKVKKIGEGAFFGAGLKKITIPKTVTSIGSTVFGNNKNLTKIAVSSSNTKYSAKDGVLYNKAKTKLIAYPSAKTDTSFTIPSTVKKIGTAAFEYNKKLKSLTIGSKVTEIGEYAFLGCSKLKTVVVGANVETIGLYAFANCSALKTVKFKGAAPEFVSSDEELTNAFEDYAMLAFAGDTTTIKYPSSEKSSWTKSVRSKMKAGAELGGGKLTFTAY